MLIKCLGAAGMNLKGLLRTRSLVALCVAAAVYLLDGYFYYVSWDEGSRYGTGAYSYGLMGASRGMEVFLLLLMMAGLLMVRRTREDGVEEISAAWPQGRMVMAWGQIVASAAAAGSVSLGVFLVDMVASLGAGAPWAWVGMEIPAVILGFFLPLWIGMLAGMCAGFWIPGRSVYLVLALLWCLLGNMGSMIWEYLSLAGIVPSTYWKQVMNLAIQEEGTLQQPFNGGPLREFPRWAVKGGAALWLILLYLAGIRQRLCTVKKGKRSWPWRPLLATALGVVMLMGAKHFFEDFYTHYNTTILGIQYANELYNPEDPHSLTDTPERSAEDQVTVLENHLTVRAGYGGLKVTSIQKLQADTELNTQCFTLFRRLKVKEVRLDGRQTAFLQSKDALYVDMPKTFEKGEVFELTFMYEGMTMPQVPVNEYSVQLQAAFPWFPWPGLRSVGQMGGMLMPPSQTQQDHVHYRLEYQGPGDLYVNLEDLGNGQYSGTSDYGLVLYSGMMKKTCGKLTVHVPAALYPQADRFAQLVEYNLALYESLPDAVGWLLPEGTVEKASRRLENVDTLYVIQDMVNQDNDAFTLYGPAMELRYLNAGRAAVSAKMADSLPQPGTKDFYQRMVRQSLGVLGADPPPQELAQAYGDFERYLLFYCCYRGGLITKEDLPEAIRPENSNFKLYPAQYKKLAKAMAEASREQLDGFFLHWLGQLQEGSWIYDTRAELYEPLTDEAIYEGMMAWLSEKR